MRTQYEAKPGTVAFRVLTHLQELEKGAELSTGSLATSLGLDPNTLCGQLALALRAGRIFKRQKGGSARSPNFWSLVDHSKGVEVDAAQEQLAPAPTARWPHAFEASPSPSPANPPRPDGDELPEPGMQPHQVVTKVQSGAADSSIRETVAASSAANPLQSVWAAAPSAYMAADTPEEAVTISRESLTLEANLTPEVCMLAGCGRPVRKQFSNYCKEHFGEILEPYLAGPRVTITQVFPDGSSMAQEGIVSELTPSLPAPEPEVKQDTSTDAMRFGIWDNGELHVVREGKTEVWSKQQFTQLIAFLDSISLDVVRVGDVA